MLAIFVLSLLLCVCRIVIYQKLSCLLCIFIHGSISFGYVKPIIYGASSSDWDLASYELRCGLAARYCYLAIWLTHHILLNRQLDLEVQHHPAFSILTSIKGM